MYKIQNMFDGETSNFVPCLLCKENIEEHLLINGYCSKCAELDSEEICDWCHEPFKNGDYRTIIEVYNSPWDVPVDMKVHVKDDYKEDCSSLIFDSGYHDFSYFTCAECERNVIVRCPSNGWHTYYRLNDFDEMVCLKCYEENILKNGISREKFETNAISGMFFNDGELEEKGYSQHITRFINSKSSAKDFCKEAIKKIDEGFLVVVEYDRMGIGGSEGTVTMWIKQKDEAA